MGIVRLGNAIKASSGHTLHASGDRAVHARYAITARRDEKGVSAKRDASEPAGLMFADQIVDTVPSTKGEFILRNLHAGIYRLNVQPPSAGWYLRSVALAANTRSSEASIIANGITLKTQTISGLTITMSGGAAGIRGHVTASERQPLPSRVMVYLVPAEKENANSLLRFFETRAASDGKFAINNIAPGDYFIMANISDNDRPAGTPLREDVSLRSVIVREAENVKQKLTLKPCERIDEYELAYSPATKP